MEYISSVTAVPPRVELETAISARIDGGNTIGYLTALQMVEIAQAKAEAHGVAVVGAHSTVFTGRNAYYVERLAERGLVAVMMNSFTAVVAPWGASEPVFGTNPLSVAMPARGEVFVYDISTAVQTDADLRSRARREEPLPTGVAFDADGHPTTDPLAALSGCVAAFGEHRGSGLALVVQAFGTLAGGAPVPKAPEQSGFFLLAIAPRLLGDPADSAAGLSLLLGSVRSARPLNPDQPVRVPGDGAHSARARVGREGIDVDADLAGTLEHLAPRPAH